MHITWRNLICLLSLLVLTGAVVAKEVKAHYVLVESIRFPGSVKWDFLTLDSLHHRLFITRGDSVDVWDTTSKTVVASIPDLKGVHGVALASDLNKGFITEGKANDVKAFDLKSFMVSATIPTGQKPDAVIYDPSSGKIFAANGESNDVTVIDAKEEKTIGTIALGGAPESGVVDNRGTLYINLEDKAQIAAIDIRRMRVRAYFDLAPACQEPTGLAVDLKAERLFSTCGNKTMVVVDARSGKILDTLPIGDHSDGATFDPATGLAFSSNGNDGTLTIVGPTDSSHYKVIQNAKTALSARTMALDPTTHVIYLPAADTDGFEKNAAGEIRLRTKPNTFRILIMAPSE